MTETIVSTHCTYPQRDGQAEMAWGGVGWLHTEVVLAPEDGLLIPILTETAQPRVTSLIRPTPLPLRQTATRGVGKKGGTEHPTVCSRRQFVDKYGDILLPDLK